MIYSGVSAPFSVNMMNAMPHPNFCSESWGEGGEAEVIVTATPKSR